MAVVYQHTRLDNNNIFYIGIGKKEDRAYTKTYRNKYWNNTVNKYGYNVDIICKDVDYDTAKQIESYLIKYYGRKDLGLGNLVNMTDGGDGVLNHSKESIDKIKKAHIGRVHSEKEKTKRANSLRGKKRTIEQRQKISESLTGRVFSDNHKKKLSESHIGLIPSNAKKVIDLKTKKVYVSLRNACVVNNLSYKNEHARLSRNPNSTKNKFKYL